MGTTANDSLSDQFERVNGRRRAVRKFDDRPVSDATLLRICGQAQLAPSSRNSQPYKFLCVRSKELKTRIALLCNDQTAARSAAALVVLVAGPSLAMQTLDAWGEHLASDCGLESASIVYHRAELKQSRSYFRVATWPIWSLLITLLALVHPTASLLPLGRSGIRHWTSRGALYAAQTFLLAASAYGLDTCPMEGFKARKLGKALGIERELMIPLVIAVGYGATDARQEPRWRKSIELTAELL